VRLIGEAGAWWSGADRVAIVEEARRAPACSLCVTRKAALSPYTGGGEHDHGGQLDAAVVDVIHRLRTDSGRLTERWFNEVIEGGLSREAYLEVTSLVAQSVIMDTFAVATNQPLATMPDAVAGEPSYETSTDVVDGGAWVPLTRTDVEDTTFGLPRAPNIARAMGLVPSAVAGFFSVFRPHYALQSLDLAINRSQTEMIAARVSSHNDCFY